MAYTTPRTWVTGEVVTAAQLNQDVRDNILFLAASTLGYAQVTANQTGIGTTVTDLTGLSVTVTVTASRRIRVTGYIPVQQQTNGRLVTAYVREGSTTLNDYLLAIDGTASLFGTIPAAVVLTPSAGSHTYKLSLATSGDTVNMIAASGRPAFILVEDIGAA